MLGFAAGFVIAWKNNEVKRICAGSGPLMERSEERIRRWPAIALAVAYALTALLHLVAAGVLAFVFGGKARLSSQPELLPLYGRLGMSGYWIFFLTIPLDIVATICLTRRSTGGRGVAVWTAALLNLPLFPFGTITGAGTVAWLYFERRIRRR